MSNIIANGKSDYQIYPDIKSSVEYVKSNITWFQYFFGEKIGDNPDYSLLNKNVNSKNWLYKDCRSIFSYNGEYLRNKNDLAVGAVFNNNTKPKTKRDLLNKTREHFIHHEFIHDVRTIIEKIDLTVNTNKNLKIKVNELHKLIAEFSIQNFKSNNTIQSFPEKLSCYDKINMPDQNTNNKLCSDLFNCIEIFENENIKPNNLINDINDKYRSILTDLKYLSDSNNLKKFNLDEIDECSFKDKINSIYEIEEFKIQDKSNILTKEHLNFFFVKKALKEDPYLKFQFVTFAYRIMYDPHSCAKFTDSLGELGKTLLTCINTRKWCFGQKMSTKYLPDSYFVLLRMLDIEEEDCQLIEKKTIKNHSHVMKLTSIGSYLYQEVSKINNNLLIENLFGTIQQGKSHDKVGMIWDLQTEIKEKFENIKINDYFNKTKIFGGKFINYQYDSSSYFKNILFNWSKLIKLYEKPDIISKKSGNMEIDCFLEKTYSDKLNKVKKILGNILSYIKNESLLELHEHDKRSEFYNLITKNYDNINKLYNKTDSIFKLFNTNETKKEIKINDLDKIEHDIYKIIIDFDIDMINEDELKLCLNHFMYSYSCSSKLKEEEILLNSIVKIGLSGTNSENGVGKLLEILKDKIEKLYKDVIDKLRSRLKSNTDLMFIKDSLLNHESLKVLIFFYENLKEHLKGKDDNYIKSFKKNDSKQLDKFIENLLGEFLSQGTEIKESLISVSQTFKDFLIGSIKNDFIEDIFSLCKLKINYNDSICKYIKVEDVESINDFNMILNFDISKNFKIDSREFKITTKNKLDIHLREIKNVEIIIDDEDFYNVFLRKIENNVLDIESFENSFDFRKIIFEKTEKFQSEELITFIKFVCDQFGISKEYQNKITKNINENPYIDDLFEKLKMLNTDSFKFYSLNSLRQNEDRRIKIEYKYNFDGNYGLCQNENENSSQSFFKFIMDSVIPFIQKSLNLSSIEIDIESQFEDKITLQTKLFNIAEESKKLMINFANSIRLSFSNFSDIISKLIKSNDSVHKIISSEDKNIDQGSLNNKKIINKNNFVEIFSDLDNIEQYAKNLELNLSSGFKETANKLREMQINKQVSAFNQAIFCTPQMARFSEKFLTSCEASRKVVKDSPENNICFELIEDSHRYRNIIGDDFGDFFSILFEDLLQSNILDDNSNVDFIEKLIDEMCSIIIEIKKYSFSGYYITGKGHSLKIIQYLNRFEFITQDNLDSETLYNEITTKILETKKLLIDKIMEINRSNVSFDDTILEINQIYRNLEEFIFKINIKIISNDQIKSINEELMRIDDLSFFNVDIHQKFLLITKHFTSGTYERHLNNVSQFLKSIFNLFFHYKDTAESHRMKALARKGDFKFLNDFSKNLNTNQNLLFNYSSKYRIILNDLNNKFKEQCEDFVLFKNETLEENSGNDSFFSKLKFSFIGNIKEFEKTFKYISVLIDYMKVESDHNVLNTLILLKFLRDNEIISLFTSINKKISKKKQLENHGCFENLEEKNEIFEELRKLQNILNNVKDSENKSNNYKVLKIKEEFELYIQNGLNTVSKLVSNYESITKTDFLLKKLNEARDCIYSASDKQIKSIFEKYICDAENIITNMNIMNSNVDIFNEFSKNYSLLTSMNKKENHLSNEIKNLLELTQRYDPSVFDLKNNLDEFTKFTVDFNYLSSIIINFIEKKPIIKDIEVEINLNPLIKEIYRHVVQNDNEMRKIYNFITIKFLKEPSIFEKSAFIDEGIIYDSDKVKIATLLNLFINNNENIIKKEFFKYLINYLITEKFERDKVSNMFEFLCFEFEKYDATQMGREKIDYYMKRKFVIEDNEYFDFEKNYFEFEQNKINTKEFYLKTLFEFFMIYQNDRINKEIFKYFIKDFFNEKLNLDELNYFKIYLYKEIKFNNYSIE